jgi:hypothetical protein
VAVRSPNLNAYAIRSPQKEYPGHFLLFGLRHLDHVVNEYLEHYNTERPHQAKGNVPLTPQATPPPTAPPGGPRATEVLCRSRLGGLLRHYYRRAA